MATILYSISALIMYVSLAYGFVLFISFILFFLSLSGIIVMGEKCPNCKRRKLFEISDPASEPSPYIHLFKVQYQCKSCGYSKHEFVSSPPTSGSVSWPGGASAGGCGGSGGCG